MDLAAVDEVVRLSVCGDERAVTATRILDTLRMSDDRWDIGLQLFFKGSTDTAKFFGLSMVRDYLDSRVPVERRKTIRDAMMEWVKTAIVPQQPGAGARKDERPPVYLVNNVASVITLCIKHDYPELWPGAFEEVMQLGNSCIAGLDMTVRILTDLDVEVVTAFVEGGTAASSAAAGGANTSAATSLLQKEMAHNTAVKDAMRKGDVTRNIVNLLSKSAVYLRTDPGVHQLHGRGKCNALSRRCLRCMASFIGWIDVNLVISETLSTLYQALQDEVLCAPALACLYELVKKGMDPAVKAYLIHSIDVVPMLLRVPLGKSDPTEANFGADEDEDNHLFELGLIIDMIALELLGCWNKYEDMYLGDAKGNSPKGTATQEEMLNIQNVSLIVASNLHKLMPLLLQMFSVEEYECANTVLPALAKFLNTLKVQKANQDRLSVAMSTFEANRAQRSSQSRQGNSQEMSVSSAVNDPTCKYFQVVDYFETILGGIYRQMQYPDDFEYDANDEDDAEVMEVCALPVIYDAFCLFFFFVCAFIFLPLPILPSLATTTASGSCIALMYAPSLLVAHRNIEILITLVE